MMKTMRFREVVGDMYRQLVKEGATADEVIVLAASLIGMSAYNVGLTMVDAPAILAKTNTHTATILQLVLPKGGEK